MKKKTSKILRITMLSILALILVTQLFYLPRYWMKRTEIIPSESTGEELIIMSANVRCYAPDDLFQKSWFYRANLLANDIAEVAPDVIGFQEVQGVHYNYLKSAMSGYESIIAFRDNSIIQEGCAIFYRADRFEKIEEGSFG